MENKTCRQCRTNFTVTDDDLVFYEKISPEFAGKKYLIPSPTLCPECRLQKRLYFRNLRTIYRRKSDKSGIDLISNYAPNSQVKVYNTREYHDDDATKYGRNFDFSRNFFEQFKELYYEVPKPNLTNDDSSENADFFNGGRGVKNAYMSFSAIECENIYYSESLRNSKQCFDCYRINKSEICYECVNSSRLYHCFYCLECSNCHDCFFSINLSGCQDCFGCLNLQNKQYYIYNQPRSKDEYQKFINEFKFLPDTIKHEQSKLQKLYQSVPQKYAMIIKSEDCNGEYVVNSKECHDCYDIVGGENVHYGFSLVSGIKDCMDVTYFGINLERCYMSQSLATDCSNVLFCSYVYNVAHNILYSIDIWKEWNSSDLFGCVGLGKKQYCILNKQYSKEDYLQLVPKIIEHMQKTGEWGEFFPYEISPFGYNETEAMDYFPINKTEALKLGANWQDEDFGLKYDGPFYQPKDISSYNPKINPDAQTEINELLQGIIKCEITSKPFKIISQELAFYIEHSLPIPTKHPNQRYKERFAQRRPRKLYPRQCMCTEPNHNHAAQCPTEFQTTYAPDRPEKVYCEECYQKSVL